MIKQWWLGSLLPGIHWILMLPILHKVEGIHPIEFYELLGYSFFITSSLTIVGINMLNFA